MRRPPRRGPLVALPALACLALSLSACDADDGSTATGSSATTPAPTTDGATVDQADPTTDEPTTDEATTDGPTTDGPTTEDPSTEDPSSPEPTTAQDDAGQSATELGAGDVLTDADTGARVRLAVGESAVLRLEPPLQDLSPDVSDPGVVEVVPVQHFADPGYAEYELLALEAGEVTLTVGEDEELLVDLVVDGP